MGSLLLKDFWLLKDFFFWFFGFWIFGSPNPLSTSAPWFGTEVLSIEAQGPKPKGKTPQNALKHVKK